MNLIEKANAIIHQWYYTKDNINELCQIMFDMSVAYKDYCDLYWLRENWYNTTRTEKFIEKRKEAKEWGKRWSIEDCREYARNESEQQYWDYVIPRENARGMKTIIEAIRLIVINYQSDKKNMDAIR